jgi:ankyrin repeat protein
MIKDIFNAINNNDIVAVKKSIKAGADVNAKNICGNTPLIEACMIDNYEIAEVLIEAKADVNAESDLGYTAMMEAYINKNIKIIKLLMLNGADYNKEIIDLLENYNNKNN